MGILMVISRLIQVPMEVNSWCEFRMDRGQHESVAEIMRQDHIVWQ